MRVEISELSVVYESTFARPALSFVANPHRVLGTLFNSLAARWPISLENVTVTPSNRASEVRVRLTVFNGQGVVEVDGEKVGLQFRNARFGEDLNTIKDAISLTINSISEALPEERLGDSTLRFNMWLNLLDEPTDANEFLVPLMPNSWLGVRSSVARLGAVTFTPAYKFELDDKVSKSHFTYELTRAYRSANELFQSLSLLSFDGTSVRTLGEKVVLIEQLMAIAWKELGIHPREKKE